MSKSRLWVLLALLWAVPSAAQVLTCAEAASGDCRAYHYHVQSYNDLTRSSVELYGTNRFATIEACQAERDRRMNVEKQAVEFVLREASRARVKESNFGPCHCDMTSDPSSRHYLKDDQRFRQMHLQREMTLQLLGEAYDKGMDPASPIVEGLSARATSFVSSTWPNATAVPPDSPDRFLAPEPPVPMPTSVSASQASQLDSSRYQLVDIAFGEELPLETLTIEAESGIAPGSLFVNEEIAAIQARLPAVLDLPEGREKERLLELIQQRFQLLSNLGRLVQTAGSRSRLSREIVAATSPEGRNALVTKLFGEKVGRSWAPDNFRDLLVEVPDAVAVDPVAVLRDASSRFTTEQKQLALYVFLMRTGTLTENQEIWLTGMIESNLENGSGSSL